MEVTALERSIQLHERETCEESLYKFLQHAWKYIDPAPFVGGWHLEAIAEHLEAITDGQIRRLIINVPPRTSKSSLISVAWPAWIWIQSKKGPLSGPQVQILSSSYAHTLSLRDSVKMRRLIQSPWYQKHWGDRFTLTGDVNTKGRFENNRGGYRLATSVDGTTTGEGGDIILADDANSATEAESDLVRQSTNTWWDESMSTRLNDPRTGAFVDVQQRLHMEDLTGHIVSREADDWVWLCLPMRYESDRHCETFVKGQKFWEDPRTEDGELLCPRRFSEASVVSLEKSLGPYACNPYEAPILMADLSMKPIGEIVAGDKIVGFDKKKRDDGKGRHKLTEATVLTVHSRIAPVVWMTLDSGEVIRCTPDHRWFTKDRGPDREMYAPVSLKRGTRLARVCPPRLLDLEPDDLRLAGWLSGFFDGEGSVSACSKKVKGADYRPSSSIAFYQGSGRNLPLCEKLEHALRHFGFEFNYTEDERKENKTAACYGYRQYRLLGNDLPMYQRFLHIVKPTKWRDRIIGGAFGAKFIKGREKVLSIEPDGEDVVYALTTTTGNYVVWGLASSNSAGQLQQRPSPRGGGIIKEEWWRQWTETLLPRCEYVIASLDPAFTEKSENDPSALTIWGIFRQDPDIVMPVPRPGMPMTSQEAFQMQISPRICLLYAWQDRLAFPDLVRRVIDTCTIDKREVEAKYRFRVDKLLIENKANGISVAQELHQQIGFTGQLGVELFDPRQYGDKVARVYAIQHMFSEGLVFAPWPLGQDGQPHPRGYQWVTDVIEQFSVFPRGSHDDLVDSTSMALRYLRETGLALRREEHDSVVESSMMHRRQSLPLYPA